jgi:large subunit ribosomal protein L25
MQSITIEGQIRKSAGKRETRELRKNGQVPCSLYGGKDTLNFSAPATSFKNLVYTPEFLIAKIILDGKEREALMQDLQFDPVTDQLTHIDFLEMNADKKVTVDIPIKLEGIPAGVRAGGKINQRMKKLKVRMYPKDLVPFISIKVDHVELGKSVRISDLKNEGFEFLAAPNFPILSVIIPRVVKEETPVAAAPAAAASPAAAPAAAAEKGAAKKDDKKKK